MPRLSKAALLFALTSAAGGLFMGSEAEKLIPDFFFSSVKDRESPIWVSAGQARTPDGHINWKLFSAAEQDSLRRTLISMERVRAQEQPKSLSLSQTSGNEQVRDENCALYQETFYHASEGPVAPGFIGLVKSARRILSGSVSGVSQGFFMGSPASILRLDVSQTWKADAGFPPGDIYAVYPFARFAIGGDAFCAGSPGSVVPPRVGQRVLAFITSAPLGQKSTLTYIEPKMLIIEGPGGKVFLPRALRQDPELAPAQTFDEVEELLRRALAIANRGRSRLERPGSGK